MSTATTAEPISVIAEKVMTQMNDKLGDCPKCRTRQFLNDIWLQKKNWGGVFDPQNRKKLCAPCDEEYRAFVETSGKLNDLKNLADYEKIFQEFLALPKLEIGAYQKSLMILKELAGMRVQIAIEHQRYLGRFRSRSKRLDEVHPIEESIFAELAEEISASKKKKDSQKAGWLDVLISQTAEVKALRTGLEKEIAERVKLFPIWTEFTKHIPGIGEWLTGFFIAAIKDPREVQTKKGEKKTSGLWGHAGLRVNEDGKAQSRTREKLDYDPTLKTVMVNILPKALLWQKTRFPDSPYSKLFDEVRQKEIAKAINANPQKCYIKGCNETKIINLGFRKDEERGEVFQGYCCAKTHGKQNA
ncbi:MAG TPA: hypothetical protein VJ103_02495, partial [Candidatus Paceibacterota bacterium]|nr:hypothetical protein [Candidatus Paceibacterota bacterium]